MKKDHQTQIVTRDPLKQQHLAFSDSGKALGESEQGQILVAREINTRFHAMKTFGKSPESLASITEVLMRDLGEFPAEKVMKAFQIHAQNSDEFPTSHNLVSILKNKGRKAVSREVFMRICRIAPEERTASDWEQIERYEMAERYADWEGDEENQIKKLQDEVMVLRKKLSEVKQENDYLQLELKKALAIKSDRPVNDKVANTIAYLKANGYSDKDIEDFRKSQEYAN